MAVVDLCKTFRFEAAHRLPAVPEGHKCGRLHGHSWQVTIVARGDVVPAQGWYRDFGDISAVVKPVIAELDHRYLNELPGLANPTSEVLAMWLWARLAPDLPGLCEIQVQETPTSGCIFRGEGR